MIKLLNDNLKRKADRLTKKSEKVFPNIYILIVKWVTRGLLKLKPSKNIEGETLKPLELCLSFMIHLEKH